MGDKYFNAEFIDDGKTKMKNVLSDFRKVRDHTATSLLLLSENQHSLGDIGKSINNLKTLLELIQKDSEMLVPVMEDFVDSLDDFTNAKDSFFDDSKTVSVVQNFEND